MAFPNPMRGTQLWIYPAQITQLQITPSLNNTYMSREISNMTMAIHNLGVCQNQIQTGVDKLTKDLEKANAQLDHHMKLCDKLRLDRESQVDRYNSLLSTTIQQNKDLERLIRRTLELEEMISAPLVLPAPPCTEEAYHNLLAWREQDKATINMLKGANRHLIEALSALESSKAVG